MTYPINTNLITNNQNRSLQTRTETRHLVVHSTDDPGAMARNLQAYWSNNNANANAHGAIDPTQVLLMLPLTEKSWSVGEPANDFTLNFELCMPAQHDQAYFASLWSIATWFYAKLCHDYGKDASWIKSHDEIRQLYGGTDHTDPVEYFAEYDKTVDDFRSDVAKQLAAVQAPPVATAPTISTDAALKVIADIGALFNASADVDVQKASHWSADALRVKIGALTTSTADTSFSVTAAQKVITDLGALYNASASADVQAAAHYAADALRKLKGITQ